VNADKLKWYHFCLHRHGVLTEKETKFYLGPEIKIANLMKTIQKGSKDLNIEV